MRPDDESTYRRGIPNGRDTKLRLPTPSSSPEVLPFTQAGAVKTVTPHKTKRLLPLLLLQAPEHHSMLLRRAWMRFNGG
jgi:hypothetical protein